MAGNPHDLERFVAAQAPVFETVLAELKAGSKRTHWMWFIFPQLRGLGRSSTAQFYGIRSAEEARAYLGHPVLGPRLVCCTELVAAIENSSLNQIFGSPDDMKFVSSMTLFALASPEDENVFQRALDACSEGRRDERTVALIENEESMQ